MRAVIVGAGEVGLHIAARLSREKAETTLVDLKRDRLDQAADSMDIQVLAGSGADPSVLAAAGLAEADLLAAVSSSDEVNLLACRLAQIMVRPETSRLARIRSSGFFDFFDERRFREDFGVDFIINPSREAVETIMDFIEFPGASDVIEVAEGRLRLVGLRLPRRRHQFVNKSLAQLRSEEAPLIAAIHRNRRLLIPKGETTLKAGDLIYAAAAPEDASKVRAFYGLSQEPARQATIVGGGELGYHLARRLAADVRGFKVKLIEMNPKRCEYLSSRLPSTMIIKGDGTDHGLLLDEGAGETDAFIAVSASDEMNLIACLMARRLGARQTITRINRSAYAPLVDSIGLGAMVSDRVAAARAALRYLRRGRVISAAALTSEDVDIIEFRASPAGRAAGKRLMDLKFPEGALVVALSRGEKVSVPRGASVIEAGDLVAVLARPEAIGAAEKILAPGSS